MVPPTVRPFLYAFVCLLAPLCHITDANAQAAVSINVSSEEFRGERVRGPRTIELVGVNTIRYEVLVGQNVTFSAAPDLRLPFIPPIPAAAVAMTADTMRRMVKASRGNDLEKRFIAVLERLAELETARGDAQTKIVTAVALVNDASQSVRALAEGATGVLQSASGGKVLLGLVHPTLELVTGAVGTRWPAEDVLGLSMGLDRLWNDVNLLSSGASADDWKAFLTDFGPAYTFVRERVPALQALARPIDYTSEAATTFAGNRAKLYVWKLLLEGTENSGEAAFKRATRAGCGFTFDQSRETKVEVVMRDRLAAPGAAEARKEITTVVCSSPISVSAGFGFSSIDEREYVFVESTKPAASGAPTKISRFGYKNQSGFRPLPVLLVNTRVWEPADGFAVHATAGAAVDVKTGAAGTDIEYIIGPSFSFWRSLFFTLGLHVGRSSTLTGGFAVDQEVPEGVTNPPVTKNWNSELIFTASYRLR